MHCLSVKQWLQQLPALAPSSHWEEVLDLGEAIEEVAKQIRTNWTQVWSEESSRPVMYIGTIVQPVYLFM